MGNSKIVAGNEVLIDLTGDTITAADLAYGVTAHGANGDGITGTSTKDVDSTDGTAVVAEILVDKTAYARGAKLTGTMPNNGGVTGIIDDVDDEYAIPQGYHDGSGTVAIDPTEQAKLIPANIKSGVEILGVTGTYSGEAITAQSKSATPTFSQQAVLPDAGYDYLSQVTVAAIPITRTLNASGGYTVTIG